MARVLVVDDDVAVRLFCRTALTRDGHEVIEAHDGADALEQLAGGLNVDLILLDIKMPRLDGNEFLESIRTQSTRPPILVLSAYTGMLREDLADIPVKVIEKPLVAERLCHEVASALEPDSDM